jgi:type IV pilus assembly protein PilM
MSFLDSFFKKKEDARALGIDIGSSAIKIVQLKKKNGQAVLETYGELALGPYAGLSVGQAVQLPVDKIAQAVTDLMKEKEVNVTTKLCGLSIPFASSLMSVVEMPDVGPDKLKSMVPLEARKYIPVPIQEVMLDWSVIPKAGEEAEEVDRVPAAQRFGQAEPAPALKKTDVLIVAIHNDTIARYQDIVQRSGLAAGFFEIEVFSTMRSVLDEPLKPVLVMDMGAASTKLYILERGIVRASHTVNRGAQDVTAALANSLAIPVEEAEVIKRQSGLVSDNPNAAQVMSLVLDHIWSETQSTLLAYEKKSNKPVAKVLMVGGGASLKGILELAKENFKIDVELGLPFNKVSAPAFLDNILRETGPEFAVAIGLALRKLSEE